jgi:hypothetical protein
VILGRPRPWPPTLLGTTLRFDYEVRSEKEYFSHIPSPRISKDMVSLASHILETKAATFDPGKFKDEYETALRKLVQRKAKGHTSPVILGFRPKRTPLAIARVRPSPVLARIKLRSNSASPPRTVSINRPCGVVVSAH